MSIWSAWAGGPGRAEEELLALGAIRVPSERETGFRVFTDPPVIPFCIVFGQRAWTECHVAAFGFFGGVPARLVPEYVPRNIFRLLCPAGLCGQ
jgi:transposase